MRNRRSRFLGSGEDLSPSENFSVEVVVSRNRSPSIGEDPEGSYDYEGNNYITSYKSTSFIGES